MNVIAAERRYQTGMDILLEFLEFIERPRPKSLHELLKRVLTRSRALMHADAGAIYTFTRRGGARQIAAVEVQFEDRRHRLDELVLPVNSSSIAGYVALSGETVREDDVYRIPADRPYRFNQQADQAAGYRCRSMLCFPLTNYEGEVIAVVQLVNRRRGGNGNDGGGKIVAFPKETAKMVPVFNRVVGGEVERTMMVERMQVQNRRLRERSKKLSEQRARITEMQGQTEEALRLSITLLARAAEIHDEGTGNHIVRVNEYSTFLAGELGMSDAFCDEIGYSAQLHDVGKMAVDMAVLKKAGSLTAADRAEMNRHPIYGHEILRPSDRLRMAAEIALSHHEKWDGSGYPRGLKGEEIPISARIVQMADIYDALRSPRHYKGAIDHRRAVRIILEGDERIDSAGHFDPALRAAFADCHKGFDRIWRNFADE